MTGTWREFPVGCRPLNTALRRPPRGPFSYPGVSTRGVRHSPEGTPKSLCDKDFAKLSGELSGAICLKTWKATKQYLNQRGTKIGVFRVRFRARFLPRFFPHLSPLFPLQGLFTLQPLLPSSPPPLYPHFLTPGKL